VHGSLHLTVLHLVNLASYAIEANIPSSHPYNIKAMFSLCVFRASEASGKEKGNMARPSCR
jgi:hypothetical protein